jgi:2-amino-4-hydroxy-6-hydroxymethyldihydropteridine diphosphokinase
MIIISLGANVTSRWGKTEFTIFEALRQLERHNVRILRTSRMYETAPLGLVQQPNFTNAVTSIRTSLPPRALLTVLKKIETKAGRRQTERWGPRPLDLDIIDYNQMIISCPKANRQAFKCTECGLILPHPGIASRAFVLRPLLEIAPYWHHPVNRLSAAQMLKHLRYAKMGQILNVLNGDFSRAA